MWLVSGIHAAFSHACGLIILIGYDAMWLASGICAAFSYVGVAILIRHSAMWLVSGIHAALSHACGLVILIGYDVLWLASGIREAFSYVGWQVGSSMKLRGWLVGFLRYTPIWAWPGVRREAV